MTPEGKVKARVKALLKRFGAYYHMVVQNGMGAPSLDFVGCHEITITPDMVGKKLGLFFAVETKAGNKDMTDRQKQTASEMRKSGAEVFLVNDVEGLAELEQWLKEVCDAEQSELQT